jgi:hypothetical protein
LYYLPLPLEEKTMADVILIQPAEPGRRVRDPITRAVLPDAGAEKPRSPYWLRRLRDGDVIEIAPAAPPAGPPAPAPTDPHPE